MKPLIDGDIIVYEVGFAAETGWRHKKEDPDAIPPFDYVLEILHERLAMIGKAVNCDFETQTPIIYLTEGKTFRDKIAVTKPYKGTRKEKKPWHYKNITAYLKGVMDAVVVTGIEADDQLAIDHLKDPKGSIICTRDKDLKQIPGYVYSWELNLQPSFGPKLIDRLGDLSFKKGGKTDGGNYKPPKLSGTGYKWFCAQLIMGDPVDNIPGCPGKGPKIAYEILKDLTTEEECFEAVQKLYDDDELLLEQGQLLWICRKINPDGTPVLWQLGMTNETI